MNYRLRGCGLSLEDVSGFEELSEELESLKEREGISSMAQQSG